ncbi:MAG TPA: Fe-S cluster assembly protein SufD [Thermopetrobacter sp.]|nr:Fe-S cluster assembly protein SufD [Thermopetrobacter sp.]
MTTPIKTLAAYAHWLEALKAFPAPAPWLLEKRKEALDALSADGLPTPRTEDWRWSDIHRYLNAAYTPAAGGAVALDEMLAANPFAGLDASVMVFANGVFVPDASMLMEEDGVDVIALSEMPIDPDWLDIAAGEDAFDRLNLAHATDGALIRVRAGLEASIPLVILNISDGDGSSHALRHLIRVEEGAAFSLFEAYVGGGDHVLLETTKARLDAGAKLSRLSADLRDDQSIAYANLHATVEAGAALSDISLYAGGRHRRQQNFVQLAGDHADATVDAACLLHDRQHVDTRLVVDHLAAQGASRELFRCVVDDHARGSFEGKIHVAPGAAATDARMGAHGLLLSETAEFDAKPELQIFHDDVVCAHGATAGALDAQQLFYLRARGVPEKQARALLIAAFVAEVFDAVEDEAARTTLRAITARWLGMEDTAEGEAAA